MNLRLCKGCSLELPANLETFPPQKGGKYGLYTHCRPCKKAQDAERRARPDQKARQQAWRDANKDRVKESNKAYRDAGYSSTEHVARWRAANPDRSREADRLKRARYRKTQPWSALKNRISSRVRSMLLGCGGKSRATTESLLGYAMADLVKHIERQFTDGMTWDALLAGHIHIDHIIPVSSFKPTSPTCPEFKRCWALSNLRPMWAKDNMAKGSKVEHLL